MIYRYIQLPELVQKKTTMLFGPRSTGKSFWIKQQLSDCVYIDLLKAVDRRRFIANPSTLEEVVRGAPGRLVVIDEIQLIPELLDEVHRLIENTQTTFLLTGSSARKLKRSGANMLGGRARQARLHPLCWWELKQANRFDLHRYLQWGGIPRIYLSDEPLEEMSDYVDAYLEHEIKAEAVSRNISGFERFFQRVALLSGEEVNYSKIASDAQLSGPTVRQYIEVLEDTLLCFFLTPWQGSKRKAVQRAKFYLFDIGVTHFLAQIASLPTQSNLFGRAFESFIVQEIVALCSYKRKRANLHFWRTQTREEVDLIIGEDFAIEIKSTETTTRKDCRNLVKLLEEGFSGRRIVVSRDTLERTIDGIEMMHYEVFLEMMWTQY
ncbi:MAG: ATP-binding protein [Deltaproteobacteria bacterium]|nr:ATP-binding protein [Deltaproteobacteria bacterium]MBN2674360.1 ATP-binding protein [Deltaproteobacteria bacterium]